ncbi:MAG: DNA polymerase III subunit delta [Bacilli bacterium]
MNNTTFIWSNDPFIIKQKIKEIGKGFEIINHDYKNVTPNFLINEIGSISLFGNKKCVVVNNCTFLNKKDDNIEILFNYLRNNNIINIIIFTSNTTFDKRLKNTKALIEESNFIEIDSKKIDKIILIKNRFSKFKYKIDLESIKLINEYTKGDINSIYNEIEKLIMLCLETKQITVKDVKSIVTKYPEDDIFKLLNAFTSNNKKEILEVYDQLIESGIEQTVIMSNLASSLRVIYTVYLNENLNDKQIATESGLHLYRIKLARTYCKTFSLEKVKYLLNKLYEMDLKIKKGQADKKRILEEFLITENL